MMMGIFMLIKMKKLCTFKISTEALELPPPKIELGSTGIERAFIQWLTKTFQDCKANNGRNTFLEICRDSAIPAVYFHTQHLV